MERKLRYGIRIFLIISILIAGLHNTAVAQKHQEQKSVSTAKPFDIGYKIQGMSPQTASMIMYDKIPTLQNTGRLDLSIPIVHFDDPDFDFPISIRYNSEGFKPNEPDNYVGRDWSLECGGIIYREIKGKPDDMLPSPYTAGFLWNVESHRQNPETVKKDILSGSPLSHIGTHIVEDALSFKNNKHRGEFSSDIYHFCFGKHSGKFMIDFDGSVIVSGNDGGHYTVDISRYKLRDTNEGYNSEIRIKTDDGYTYCFGGSYGAVDYVALVWERVKLPVIAPNRISGFYLSKIIAPNGRELKISYLGEDIAQEYHDKPALLIEDGRYNELIEKGYNKYYSYSATPTKSLSIDCMPVNYNWMYVNGLVKDEGIRQTLNKMALISRVTTDDTEIIFSYEDRKKVNISNDAVSQFAVSCGARLKSVIKRCAVVTERTTFEHTYKNSSFMLLKSVTNSIDGKHTFEYNRIFNTPCTQNVDYWGYSRNNMTTAIGVIPDVPESVKNDNMSGNDYGYTTFEKDPCFNSYSEALLSRIIFPTGGSLEIGYGQNEYSSYFVKNSESSFYKKLVDGNINYPCGGARVSRLQYSDSDMKQLKKVVYKYTAYPDEFKSSGILEFTPQYYHIWRTKNDPANNFEYYLLYSSDGFNTDDYTEPIVTYSTVTEYTTDTTVNTTSPRKFWFLSISPPETDKEISGTIELGIHNPLFPSMADAEKELTRWTFRVELSQSKNCSGTISISKVGVGEVYKKVIRGDRNEYVRHYETINPVEKYGPGQFIVKIGKTGSSYVRFDQNLPNLSIEKVDGYATITRYTDHHSNPDEYPDEKMIFQCRDYLHPASVLPVPELDEQYLRHNFLEMQDRSLERGKVRQQILLNRMGDTVQIVDYNYIRLEQPEFAIYASERPVIANAVTASLFVGINKEYFYCYKPSSCSVDTYDIDSKSMHNRCEHWRYDDKGYVRRHTLCINSKDMVETYYTYCHERDGADKNFYGKIKEISEDLTGPEGRNMRSHIVYSYNDKGKIASVKEPDSQDNVIKYEYFSHFDKYGNPTMSESSTGLKCVYIWGFYGKYPMAVIENATYEEVVKAFGRPLEEMSDVGGAYTEEIDKLRELLPNALVTTYRWKHQVGMIERIDPSGTSTKYEYDSANRLISESYKTENAETELLREYKYNLIGDNAD